MNAQGVNNGSAQSLTATEPPVAGYCAVAWRRISSDLPITATTGIADAEAAVASAWARLDSASAVQDSWHIL